jgi:exopolysaccharide biosynthesis operon protein EpsL
MRARPSNHLTFLLLCSSYATGVSAQAFDPISFDASYAVQRDDNLFRLSDNANTRALLGRDSAAERIDIRSLGMTFDKSWSLQNLRLVYRVVDYQYQNFSYLSFTALNHDLAWRWNFTPRVTGTLSSSEQEVQSSFTDFQGYSIRNTRTDSSRGFSTRAEIDGLWNVQGSVSTVRRVNQYQLLSGNDYSGQVVEAGVQYDRPTLNSAKLSVRQTDGTYLNRSLPSAGLYDDRFRQMNYEMEMRWIPSGWSDVSVMAGYLDRTHPNYAQRNFAGVIGRGDLNMTLIGNTRATLGYTRELGDYLSNTSSYTVTDRRAAGLTWQATNRIQFGLQHSQSTSSFFGAVTPTSSQREDDNRSSTLSASWQPDERISLMASWQTISRTSNQAGLDFVSHMASLTLQANL